MLTYYLLVPLLYALAALPAGILFIFSDLLAFVLQRIAGYRKKVVVDNLTASFPEKTKIEIDKIATAYYRILGDRAVESIRCMSISKEEIDKRITVKNAELINEVYEAGRSIVLLIGHIGCWEYATFKIGLCSDFELFGLVSPLSNRYFNDMVVKTRGRMGMHIISAHNSRPFFEQKLTKPSLIAFIADQSPSNPQKAYWSEFLNRKTAFFTGAERYAHQHDCVVVYAKLIETERGYFTGEFVPITYHPNDCAPNEITEKFVRLLEEQIKNKPVDWLWSHKRWKHKYETVFGEKPQE